MAHFYSLKTEKIPPARVVLGNWLSGYFTKYGVRELAGLDPEACGNSCHGAWSVSSRYFCPVNLL